MKQKHLKEKATRIFIDPGDALRGEKVTAQFRRMQKPVVLTGTSAHRIQQSRLEGSVFCVIERPLNYLRELSISQREKAQSGSSNA